MGALCGSKQCQTCSHTQSKLVYMWWAVFIRYYEEKVNKSVQRLLQMHCKISLHYIMPISRWNVSDLSQWHHSQADLLCIIPDAYIQHMHQITCSHTYTVKLSAQTATHMYVYTYRPQQACTAQADKPHSDCSVWNYCTECEAHVLYVGHHCIVHGIWHLIYPE